MPDWTTRVRRERSGDLVPGEQLVAATFFQGRGTAAALTTYGMRRGVAHDVFDVPVAAADQFAIRARDEKLRAAREQNDDPEGTIAANFPSDRGVIAVTDRRLIVFGYKQGMFSTKILDPVGLIDRTQLQAWSLSKSGISALLSMGFTDGSSIGVEVPKVNKPERFAAEAGIPIATD